MRKDGPISPPFWLDADSTGVWYHCALSLPPPSSSKARGTLRLVVRSFVADKNAFPPPLLSPCIMACHARTRRPWKEKTGADTGAAGGSLAMGALNKERKPLPTSALLALKGRTAPKILFRLRRVVLFRLRCIDWGVGKERDSWGLLFFGHRRPLHGAFARTATVGTLGMGRLHPRPPHSCRQGPPPTYAGGSGVSGCDSEAGFFDGDYLFACFVAIYPAGHLSLLPRCPCPLVLARKIEREKKGSIPYKKKYRGR